MKIYLKNNCSFTGMVVTIFILLLIFQIDLRKNSKPQIIVWKKTQDTKGMTKISINQQAPQNPSLQQRMIICDRSSYYDLCSINGPTVFDPIKYTFYLMGFTETNIIEKLKPYPRKGDIAAMISVKNVTLISGSLSPPCLIHHNVTALVFSLGGYTGNFFHDFSDVFFPIFITVNSIIKNQEYVMVISNIQDWWFNKYRDLLTTFTKHPIIYFDRELVTHCFPSAHLGLIKHGPMTIDPKLMPNSKTIKDFRSLLEIAYNPNKKNNPKPSKHLPLLVIISRGVNDGREILNEHELRMVAETIGFRVIIFQPRNDLRLANTYGLLNSSHAMLGVHGAALTHLLFLRPGAVFIQIVPIGLEDPSDQCFGKHTKELGLEYFKYKIGVNETTLNEKYHKDRILVKRPKNFMVDGWHKEMVDFFLREQNVNLDLNRFRKYLNNAYEKAKLFMNKYG